MTLQLTESQVKAMAESAGDVGDMVNSMKRMVPEGKDVHLKGFETQAAMNVVAQAWETKVLVNSNDWKYSARALELTASHVVRTDQDNAFMFPR